MEAFAVAATTPINHDTTLSVTVIWFSLICLTNQTSSKRKITRAIKNAMKQPNKTTTTS